MTVLHNRCPVPGVLCNLLLMVSSARGGSGSGSDRCQSHCPGVDLPTHGAKVRRRDSVLRTAAAGSACSRPCQHGLRACLPQSPRAAVPACSLPAPGSACPGPPSAIGGASHSSKADSPVRQPRPLLCSREHRVATLSCVSLRPWLADLGGGGGFGALDSPGQPPTPHIRNFLREKKRKL